MPSLLLRSVSVLVLLLSLVTADANFYDVRTHLVKDFSGHRGPPGKYFHESSFHPHYDGRFADREVIESERLPALTNMMKTFLSTMSDIGAETWIMHGTLLGWWWNQKILPWDTDIDVQVSVETITMLAKYFNMTEYHYQLPGGGKGTYLLEINPNYVNGGTSDRHNRIDARWIDTDHGLFIDISTVRPDLLRRAQGVEGALLVKDTHTYLERDIFPLRDSFFEGIHVKVPFEYTTLLAEEYGQICFVATEFANHRFDDTSKLWEPMVRQQGGESRQGHGGAPGHRDPPPPPTHWGPAGQGGRPVTEVGHPPPQGQHAPSHGNPPPQGQHAPSHGGPPSEHKEPKPQSPPSHGGQPQSGSDHPPTPSRSGQRPPTRR